MDDQITVLLNQAITWSEQGRLSEAMELYRRVLAADPDNFDALQGMGIVRYQMGDFDEGLRLIVLACAIQPNNFLVYYNLGKALDDLKRYQEALINYDKAIYLEPRLTEAHNNRGTVLQNLKRFEDALVSYDQAISLKPDYAQANFNKGFLKLLLGNYEEGWPLYEWRRKTDQQKDLVRNFKQPLWLGDQSIAGKTILLHPEQGLGDVIQFVRYVPMIEALGAKVILEVPASLASLLCTLKGTFSLTTQGDALPDFDLHCPIMSLPLALRTTVDTIPAEVPYLTVNPQKQSEVRTRLGTKVRQRIGLAWSGNASLKNDSNRSLTLRTLEPLLRLNFEYHSLQKEIRPEDGVTLAEYTQIQSHKDEINDFADTAALISEMDLVITVDTSVAHLAGAMGKVVWILLPYNPDWRWMTVGSDSPWYPSARLFRQERPGDWASVLARIQSELIRLTTAAKPLESYP